VIFTALHIRILESQLQNAEGEGARALVPGDEEQLHHFVAASHWNWDPLSMELARAVKSRWSCEQPHQQMKQQLGLDHFEGRSWHGLRHHALLTMTALLFLQTWRLRLSRQGKKTACVATTARPSAVAQFARSAAAHYPNVERVCAMTSLSSENPTDPRGINLAK